MRKGFIKFRVSRVIPTFHSCRSKHPSTLPTNPVPLFLHHSSTSTSTSHKHNLTPPSHSNRFSLKRHVSSAFSSARRGCLRSRTSLETSHTESSPPSKPTTPFKPHHLIAKTNAPLYLNYDSTPPRRKIYNSAASDTERDNEVVFLPPPLTKNRSRKIRRRRRTFSKYRISTSSDSGLFSEDDEDQERETLVSTDSPSPRNYHRHVIKSKKKNRLSFDPPAIGNSSPSPSPARLSEFMRRMTPCRDAVDGKVRESFAVVKKSEDPYEDFKRSMVEMVVEKKMLEERELEELLRCFLSLNSQYHHEAIVKAFTEIWKALFCHSPSSPEL